MPFRALPPPFALVHTPLGRDAAIAEALLREAGAASRICPDLAALEAGLNDDAGFAVVTEEALRNADLRGIAAWIAAQPAWSDFPFLVLTQRGEGATQNPATAQLSAILGNVSFLERPFQPATFVSIARSTLKGRQRQFEARARIEELRESEGRLQTALLAGRLGSWEFDVEAGVLTASATCKAVFGRGPDAPFTYDDLMAGIHPQDRHRMQEAVQASIANGTDYAIEYRTIWPDGSNHWAEIRARVVRDRQGRRPRLVGVSSDITDRKTAEDRLRQLNETLEERVSLRTAELKQAHDAVLAEARQREWAEDQLRQSQKMEAVGQLTGGLAHDFNNLLAGISGSLELLQIRVSQGRTADLDRFITSAQEATARAASLTHRLLAFSRRQTLDPVPTAVDRLAAGMSELITRTVGPSVTMRIASAPDLWITRVDRNQLENALLNLCINARDAMPDGGSILIEAGNAALDEKAAPGHDMPPGEYVSISVTDTGTGMPPDVIERVFDPFFTTKPLGQGTGLGLSMVYGFVRQSGGQVRIDSAVGHGTTVRLYLPRHRAELPPPEPESNAAAAPRAAPGEAVLVVDDEPTVRMLVTEVLRELGYGAIEAVNGTSGLDILRSSARIDLLVSDVGLPGGMNGRQLADAGRALRPELKVLLITGYAESAVLGERHLAPGMAVLTKPFSLEALGRRIKALIAG
ncbi:hybrid sensor histidine kinase/response regulator [Teichococcus oryzae]|uniref:histidine kinase n=1 Tax=Teichococcus oryzae TaxID=1608942 RepID=A0A5B2TD82_9PROT|nr:hybrid sensor histidine kinase/response regulator [Pseudoroseomonas oryzae]KAA2211740.1 PAS domain-containing protein [Pseudoroseomonas oryzae]